MQRLSLTLLLLFLTESPGEVRGEGDSAGVRPGHDSVQGAEAAGEPRTAEVRRRGHHRGHQVPAGEAGGERAGSQVPASASTQGERIAKALQYSVKGNACNKYFSDLQMIFEGVFFCACASLLFTTDIR